MRRISIAEQSGSLVCRTRSSGNNKLPNPGQLQPTLAQGKFVDFYRPHLEARQPLFPQHVERVLCDYYVT